METSRGCPYHCSFCAKDNFRNGYRKRPLATLLEELDGFCSHGVEYVYFIDEIFLPNRERLVYARERVPFVQANLIDAKIDDDDAVERWREHLQRHGVWANKPVPLFPYPGSPDYAKRWGAPDDVAWERAMHDYLSNHDQ